MSSQDLGTGPDGSFSETLYTELRAIAARAMRDERADHTLQPTALVHEAWLRLEGYARDADLDEAAFRALAARTLRRVLIDHGRARRADRRGGGRTREELDPELAAAFDERDPTLTDLEAALTRLAEHGPRQAKVVELHYIGGLSLPEVARALDVGFDTVRRDWRYARAWLNRELERGGGA